jgi:hypothetical protein
MPDRQCSQLPLRLFLVGKDSHGNWVAQDKSHTSGGLFSSRREALKFALLEDGSHRSAAIMIAGVLELDLRQPALSASYRPSAGRLAGEHEVRHGGRSARTGKSSWKS